MKVEHLAPGISMYLGDCREILPECPAEIVFTDPPYGMTDAHWDTAPEITKMWAMLKAGRERATFIVTGSQPFTSRTVMGNENCFRCEWIWEKNAGSNFGTVKVQPMKEHESVLVFAAAPPRYFPVMEDRAPSGASRVKTVVNYDSQPEAYAGITGQASSLRPTLRYPRSIQKFNRERGLHPNQKPVLMAEYFLKTYSTPEDRVLDPYAGSGSFGVAAIHLGRRFTGIEKIEKYFDVSCRRFEEALKLIQNPTDSDQGNLL